MDLVENPLSGFLDDSGVIEKITEDDAAIGAVEASEAGNGAAGSEDYLFGF